MFRLRSTLFIQHQTKIEIRDKNGIRIINTFILTKNKGNLYFLISTSFFEYLLKSSVVHIKVVSNPNKINIPPIKAIAITFSFFCIAITISIDIYNGTIEANIIPNQYRIVAFIKISFFRHNILPC